MASKLRISSQAKIAFCLTVLLRILYSAFAVASASYLRLDTATTSSNVLLSETPAAPAFLQLWARFDTLWYLHISRYGYDLPASVVFYPLYPLLIRAFSMLMHPLFAALLISSVASFFLFWGFLRLSWLELPDTQLWRSLLLYVVWPTSFVFFAGYTEALCAACIVWSIDFGKRDQWNSAALWGACATLSRAAGVLAFIPLLVMALRGRKSAAWPIVFIPLTGIAYPLWLHWSGHISINGSYQMYWATRVAPPWTTLCEGVKHTIRSPTAISVDSAIFLLIFLVVIAVGKMKLEYRLYALAVVLLTLMKLGPNFLVGSIRYLLPAFPVFFAFARGLERLSKPAFYGFCAALFAFNLGWMYAFLNWSFVF